MPANLLSRPVAYLALLLPLLQKEVYLIPLKNIEVLRLKEIDLNLIANNTGNSFRRIIGRKIEDRNSPLHYCRMQSSAQQYEKEEHRTAPEQPPVHCLHHNPCCAFSI